jgi:hypothetical protein
MFLLFTVLYEDEECILDEWVDVDDDGVSVDMLTWGRFQGLDIVMGPLPLLENPKLCNALKILRRFFHLLGLSDETCCSF